MFHHQIYHQQKIFRSQVIDEAFIIELNELEICEISLRTGTIMLSNIL